MNYSEKESIKIHKQIGFKKAKKIYGASYYDKNKYN